MQTIAKTTDQGDAGNGGTVRYLRDLRPAEIVSMLVAFGVMLWVYTPVFVSWWGQWMKKDSEYSHAPLIPFISIFLIWLLWKQLLDAPVKPSASGWFFIVPSLVVMLVMSWAGATNPQGLFFPVLIWGMVIVMLGRAVAKIISFPIAYLYFMCTVPGDILTKITFPIRMISTVGATTILNLFGYQADRIGTEISLPNIVVNVASACSGFKTLIAMLALAVLFAYLIEAPLWRRGLLVAIMMPMTIVLNSLRITAVALVGNYWGAEAMMYFHDYFSGLLMIAASILILFLLARLFKCLRFNSTLLP